ncbi:MAG TPA: BlaI/MecI/CopY family transcriptional regulator [Bryobacteraceae bacterium]|nr:BlaI/MecI/CopY family transcriptional regulator [Bryobacteraceae bacterium]
MPPRSGNPLPTAAELDILAILWRRGQASVREVHDDLNKASGYTTTQKQMQLMLEKGLVTRADHHGVHLYEPAIPREQTQTQILDDLLNRAFDGSSSALIMRALSTKPATPGELDEIRGMIEEAKRRKAPK